MGKSKKPGDGLGKIINFKGGDTGADSLKESYFRLNVIWDIMLREYNGKVDAVVSDLKQEAFRLIFSRNPKDADIGLLILSYVVNRTPPFLVLTSRHDFELLGRLVKKYINLQDDLYPSRRGLVLNIVSLSLYPMIMYEDIAIDILSTIVNAILSGSLVLHDCDEKIDVLTFLSSIVGSDHREIVYNIFSKNRDQLIEILLEEIKEIEEEDDEFVAKVIKLVSLLIRAFPNDKLPNIEQLIEIVEEYVENPEVIDVLIDDLLPSLPESFFKDFPMGLMKEIMINLLGRKKLPSSVKKNLGRVIHLFLIHNLYKWNSDITFTNLCFEYVKLVWLNKSSREHKKFASRILESLANVDTLYIWDDLFISLKPHILEFLERNYHVSDIWNMLSSLYLYRVMDKEFLKKIFPFLEKFLKDKKDPMAIYGAYILFALSLSIGMGLSDVSQHITMLKLRMKNNKLSLPDTILLLVLYNLGMVNLKDKEIEDIKSDLLEASQFNSFIKFKSGTLEEIVIAIPPSISYFALIGCELLRKNFSREEVKKLEENRDRYFKNFPSHKEHFERLVRILRSEN